MCKLCKIKPVIRLLSGVELCAPCFFKYFEKKVRKTIGIYKLIEKNENVVVACSSGKDSFSLLYILNYLSKTKLPFKVSVLAIDEGLKGYRDLSLLQKYCKNNKIPIKTISFKKEFSLTLDEMIKKTKMNGCSLCGVLRRYLINKYARILKANKLATGHNLDDEAQSILMNQLSGNLDRSARLGVMTGIYKDKRFVRRIKPLYFLTEKETATYAFLRKFPIKYKECKYAETAFRNEVSNLLNKFELEHPGTKHAIVNSFLQILPSLKERYGNKIKTCDNCREPTSSNTCKVCQLMKEIKK